jgi:hypothetical protein
MSFNDLNDLEAQPSGSYSDALIAPEFTALSKSMSQKIFNITSNVALIHRYIGLLGTPRDNEKMRASLMESLEKTKTIVKDMMPDIKRLGHWDPEEIGPSGKYEQQKLMTDYQKAAQDFQNAQRLALEKQKDSVKKAHNAIDGGTNEYEETQTVQGGRGQPRPEQLQQQQQQRIHLLDDSEIAFNEALIEEREAEIQGIEQGILELNEIFRDLGTIVTEQGAKIGVFTIDNAN